MPTYDRDRAYSESVAQQTQGTVAIAVRRRLSVRRLSCSRRSTGRYRIPTAAVVRARYSFSAEQSWEGSTTTSGRSSRQPPLAFAWRGTRVATLLVGVYSVRAVGCVAARARPVSRAGLDRSCGRTGLAGCVGRRVEPVGFADDDGSIGGWRRERSCGCSAAERCTCARVCRVRRGGARGRVARARLRLHRGVQIPGGDDRARADAERAARRDRDRPAGGTPARLQRRRRRAWHLDPGDGGRPCGSPAPRKRSAARWH